MEFTFKEVLAKLNFDNSGIKNKSTFLFHLRKQKILIEEEDYRFVNDECTYSAKALPKIEAEIKLKRDKK